MTCKHLKEMYDLCVAHQLKLSSTDLIRIVCPQCGVEDVCPSILVEEYETRHHEEESDDSSAPKQNDKGKDTSI